MKALFFICFFALAAVAMGMMVLSVGGDELPAVTPAPELTELGQRMEGAHSRGASLFQRSSDDGGYALCQGATYLISLGTKIKEIKLTSQESLNLSLCRRNPETGNYHTVQSISGVSPGDYLFWGDTFRWTPYSRAAMMLAENQVPVVETLAEASVAEAPAEIPQEPDAALSQVKFELSGSPAGNPALFIDSTLAALINPGSSVTLHLEGNDRCGVSLKLKGSSDEWEHVCGFGCIDYGTRIEMRMDGDAVAISLSPQ